MTSSAATSSHRAEDETNHAPEGVCIVDKPQGMTSHDVVSVLRKRLGIRAIGHAGTLDPMATGVLVIAVGQATKLVPYLTASRKVYETTVILGETTETLDADGRNTTVAPVDDELLRLLEQSDLPDRIMHALTIERDRTSQVPPVYSAIKVDGKRSYAQARKGIETSLQARPVHVEQLDVIGHGRTPKPWLRVRLNVDKGYYVRAFARDIAATLGTVGHLNALRRTASGPFDAGRATPLNDITESSRASLMSLSATACCVLPSCTLSAEATREARVGRPVPADAFTGRVKGIPMAWLAEDGKLIAIGEVQPDGRGKVIRGFS